MKTRDKICIEGDIEDSIFLRASCSCMGDDCSHTLDLEYDKYDKSDDFPIIDLVNLHIYGKMYYKEYHSYCNPLIRLWYRLRDGIKLIFGGYIEMQYDFLFQGEKHINDYIEALQEAKKEIINRRDVYIKEKAEKDKGD